MIDEIVCVMCVWQAFGVFSFTSELRSIGVVITLVVVIDLRLHGTPHGDFLSLVRGKSAIEVD